MQGEHDLNGVLVRSFDGIQALRVVVVDPKSDVYRPKDENGTWSDAFDGTYVRIVYV